jgi:hypothetical protein
MPPEMLTYRFFAKNYRFTPDEVRELYLEEAEWLPLVELAAGEAIRIEQAREERMARSRDARR